MRHETGEAAPGGWQGRQGRHRGDAHLLAGPFVDAIPAGRWVATWHLRWTRQGGGTNDRLVAELAVSDFDGCDGRGPYLCPLHRIVEARRRDFAAENVIQLFDAHFENPGERHRLEFRVLWQGADDLFVDKVEVVRAPSR